jgi:hypothetical protein
MIYSVHVGAEGRCGSMDGPPEAGPSTRRSGSFDGMLPIAIVEEEQAVVLPISSCHPHMTLFGPFCLDRHLRLPALDFG